MRRSLPLLVLSLAAALSVCSSGVAAQDEQIWKLLQAGGHVILIRHAITTPGVGDPPGMRLDDCATQRNLSEEGRRDARRIGDTFRAYGSLAGARRTGGRNAAKRHALHRRRPPHRPLSAQA